MMIAGGCALGLALIAAIFGAVPAMPLYLVGGWWFLFIEAQIFYRLITMLDESLKGSG